MKLREKTTIQICEENNLPYTFLTNIVEESNAKAKVRATLEVISKTLCGTLGPYGSTTLIQDREGRHFATKDGYDLMNRLSFSDEVSRTVLDLVRSIASTQVLTVGDGSTSAIVVANALYNALTDPEKTKFFKKVAAKDITDILNDLSEILEEEMKSRAVPVSEDLSEIETIAMIATNNDKNSGKLFKEIYDKIGTFGFISTDVLEKKEKDSFEIKQGIEWQRGYIDDYFAKGYENKKIIHDTEPRIFLTNSTLTYNDLEILLSQIVGDVCGKQKAELVLIANDYDEDVRTFLKANRTKHLGMNKAVEMIFTAVDVEQATQSGINRLEDLAILTGVEIYDKLRHKPADYLAKPDRFVGRAEKAIITSKTTQIIGKELFGEHKKAKETKIRELIKKLEEKIAIEEPTKEDDYQIYELKKRISTLTDSTAIIHVAGKSLTERMTRERLFEDAIFATKSAIKYGYITGGNMTIPRILEARKVSITHTLADKYSYLPVENHIEFFKEFIKVIENAFLESYRNVLNNSYFDDEKSEEVIRKCLNDDLLYNLKSHIYEHLSETKVINSVDTDIQIMRSCFSIIGIMAMSNQFLTLNFSTMDQIRK
jgi:chaperonin GroEL